MPMFKALKACPDAVVIRPDFAKYVAVGAADPRHDGDAHAAGAAAVDRRGGAGPRRHRGAARRAAGRGAGALRPRRRAAGRRHRLDRAGRQPAAGEDRRRPRQAARLRGDRRGRGRRRCSRRSRCGCCPASAPHWPGSWRPWALPCLASCRRCRSRRPNAGWATTGRPWSPEPAARTHGRVDPARETKSVSAETTFNTDLTDPADLEAHLWRLCEKLASA